MATLAVEVWDEAFAPAAAPGPGEETPDRVSLLLGAGDYFIFVADRREPATVDASTDGLLDDDRRWACLVDACLEWSRSDYCADCAAFCGGLNGRSATARKRSKDSTTSCAHTIYCCRGKKLPCNAEVS